MSSDDEQATLSDLGTDADERDDEQATLSDLGTDADERDDEERRRGAVETGAGGSDLSPSSEADASQDDTGGVSSSSTDGPRNVWERECSREGCSYIVAVGPSAPSRSYPSECQICGADLQRPT